MKKIIYKIILFLILLLGVNQTFAYDNSYTTLQGDIIERDNTGYNYYRNGSKYATAYSIPHNGNFSFFEVSGSQYHGIARQNGQGAHLFKYGTNGVYTYVSSNDSLYGTDSGNPTRLYGRHNGGRQYYDLLTGVKATSQPAPSYYISSSVYPLDITYFTYLQTGIPETITNIGTRATLSNGFSLTDFQVTKTGSLDFDVYDVTDSYYLTEDFSSNITSLYLDTALNYSFGGDNFLPNHEFNVFRTYIDSETTTFTGSLYNFTLNNYLITNTGSLSFNGAGFDIDNIEVTQTGSINFTMRDDENNIIWTGSTLTDLTPGVPEDFSYTFTDGTLDVNSTYSVTWDFIYNESTYNLDSDFFTTLESLYISIGLGEDCPDGFESYNNGEYKICIPPTIEDLGIFYPLINTVIDTGEQTYNGTGAIENLYGTGTVVFGFTPGVVGINTSGLDEDCKPIFDELGKFNYTKNGTPSNFAHTLTTGNSFILGERWEIKVFGVNLIGWTYDFINFLLVKIESISGKILDVGFGIFSDYFSALRIPEREQNYCFMGNNMYLKTNLTSYYSYHEGKTINIDGKNNIELIVLGVLALFILFYINKKL